jgi:hypothetical protein
MLYREGPLYPNRYLSEIGDNEPVVSAFWQMLALPHGSFTLFSGIVILLLILLQAFMSNALMLRHKVIQPVSFTGAAAFVLISASLGSHFLQPVLASCFLLFSFRLFLNSQGDDRADRQLFDAGLFTGLAALIHFPFWTFILFGFAAILILRSPSTRDVLIFLSGFFVVALLTFTLLYTWMDPVSWAQQQFQFGHFRFRQPFGVLDLSWFILPLVIPILVLLAAVFMIQSRYMKSLIQVRLFMRLILAYGVCALLSLIVAPDPQMSSIVALFLPISCAIGYWMHYLERAWILEVAHFFWLISVLVLQWLPPT